MPSGLYTGHVAHARVTPTHNAFRYAVYYLMLDLAELDELDARLRRFSHNGRALVSFFDADHGPRDGSPLRPWIDDLLGKVGIDLEGGRVSILTFPRVLGFRFYPVSFWYCYHADGAARAVLAEVQNTFHDHHNYLMHNNGAPFDWSSTPHATKAFYVSPFIQRENVRYEFTVTEPAQTVSVTIRDFVEGQLTLTAAVSLSLQELTDAALVREVLRLGPVSARAMLLIHWQALKLAFKRVRFYPHSPPPDQETSL